MARRVTPAGIRAGEPEALAGLVQLRGSAVWAYAGAVAEPEAALDAAAEAIARFRAHVVQADDLRDVNPDSVLLRAVRESSAARAPRRRGSGARLRRLGHRGASVCELAPRLLAARANRELSHEDAVRLDRHLASCPGCRDLRENFRTAETVYAEAADTSLPEADARALLLALARAGPLAGGVSDSTAQDALALLYADTPGAQHPTRSATPPSDRPATQADIAQTPSAESPSVAAPPPTADDDREGPHHEGADASDEAGAARHGAEVGTTPGRVSFARRTVIIRSGLERSEPAALAPRTAPESPAAEPEPIAAESPQPPAEPGARHRAPAEDAHPVSAPEAQQASPTPEPAVTVADPPASHDEPAWTGPAPKGGRFPTAQAPPPRAAPTYVPPGTGERGPGAPPDSGTLARVVPGVLIVLAIGVVLVFAGIIGISNTPATSDDIEPPALQEPVRAPDTSSPPPAPAVPGSEAPVRAD